MEITIIGTINPFQKELKSNVEEVIHELGLECNLNIVHEINEVIKVDEEKHIELTPALVVDDIILTQGHIWSKHHIKEFLLKKCPGTKKTSESQDKFAYWKGVPREKIVWHPNIDESKCFGCGMCVTSCGRKVFDYNRENKKSVVARPLQCMVGCTSCRVWCVYDAISFPGPQRVRDLIKEENLLSRSQEELNEDTKLNCK